MSARQDKFDAVADALDADIVAYFGDVVRGEDDYLIQQCLKRRRRKNVLLYLSTYGGDPNAAYRISRCFQNAYNTLQSTSLAPPANGSKGCFSVYIDSVCKSAGTIICLGADKLVMSDQAELGPIDVQLRKQDEIGERTSGLTPIQAVQFLETQSVVLFRRHFKALRDSSELGFSTKMAADLATRMTVGLLEPIYSQLDPIRLAEVDRSLRISQEYGTRLANENLKEQAVEKLLARYPSHGFVIDRREAKELFKQVDEPSSHHQALTGLMGPFGSAMASSGGNTFVYFLSSEPRPAVDVHPEPAPPEPLSAAPPGGPSAVPPDAAPPQAPVEAPEGGENL